MTIGDNFNDGDAGVWDWCSNGNAPADVKAVAQWVAPRIEQDGAAAAIEEFVLQNA